MTDKTANYKSKLQKAESNKKSQIKILKKTHESQLAMKAELIHNLEELIEEQESKIEELEGHIKGTIPSQSLNVTNAKLSSIRKLVDSINDLHSEKSRIHETWLSTQSELETVKQEHKETVDNLSDDISDLETKLRKAQAENIKLQSSGSSSVSFHSSFLKRVILIATWRVARIPNIFARFRSKERPRNEGQYSPREKWNYSHFLRVFGAHISSFFVWNCMEVLVMQATWRVINY